MGVVLDGFATTGGSFGSRFGRGYTTVKGLGGERTDRQKHVPTNVFFLLPFLRPLFINPRTNALVASFLRIDMNGFQLGSSPFAFARVDRFFFPGQRYGRVMQEQDVYGRLGRQG